MIDLKTNENLERDIKLSLWLYLIFICLGTAQMISLWYTGNMIFLPGGLITLTLAIIYDSNRNMDLIRLELRNKNKGEQQ